MYECIVPHSASDWWPTLWKVLPYIQLLTQYNTMCRCIFVWRYLFIYVTKYLRKEPFKADKASFTRAVVQPLMAFGKQVTKTFGKSRNISIRKVLKEGSWTHSQRSIPSCSDLRGSSGYLKRLFVTSWNSKWKRTENYLSLQRPSIRFIGFCWVLDGLVVTVLDWQSRGRGFKPPPGQKKVVQDFCSPSQPSMTSTQT